MVIDQSCTSYTRYILMLTVITHHNDHARQP